jgi:hypothetical protein
MTRTGGPEIETESPSVPYERPWLFGFLIVPVAMIALGLVGGALTFLLRYEGLTFFRGQNSSHIYE